MRPPPLSEASGHELVGRNSESLLPAHNRAPRNALEKSITSVTNRTYLTPVDGPPASLCPIGFDDGPWMDTSGDTQNQACLRHENRVVDRVPGEPSTPLSRESLGTAPNVLPSERPELHVLAGDVSNGRTQILLSHGRCHGYSRYQLGNVPARLRDVRKSGSRDEGDRPARPLSGHTDNRFSAGLTNVGGSATLRVEHTEGEDEGTRFSSLQGAIHMAQSNIQDLHYQMLNVCATTRESVHRAANLHLDAEKRRRKLRDILEASRGGGATPPVPEFANPEAFAKQALSAKAAREAAPMSDGFTRLLVESMASQQITLRPTTRRAPASFNWHLQPREVRAPAGYRPTAAVGTEVHPSCSKTNAASEGGPSDPQCSVADDQNHGSMPLIEILQDGLLNARAGGEDGGASVRLKRKGSAVAERSPKCRAAACDACEELGELCSKRRRMSIDVAFCASFSGL